MAKRQYRLGQLPPDKKFGGQAKLIIDEIRGKEAVTVEGVAQAIGAERLQTRQTPERVVGFYFSTWKKAGFLHEIDAPDSSRDKADVEVDDDEDEGVQEETAGLVGRPIELEPAKLEVPFGVKVSDAALAAVKAFPGSTVDQLANHLKECGYKHPETARTVKAESVQGALQNLIRRGSVSKSPEGTYVPTN